MALRAKGDLQLESGSPQDAASHRAGLLVIAAWPWTLQNSVPNSCPTSSPPSAKIGHQKTEPSLVLHIHCLPAPRPPPVSSPAFSPIS